MRHLTSKAFAASVLCAMAAASAPHAQQAAPDVILANGKIITVDEKFSIAQAVAVRGDRIVAVGTNQDIARLAGPNTRRIDLRGRAVTPGLIDHHGHYLREGSTFQEEVRWEGIETRKQALDMLRARARSDRDGQHAGAGHAEPAEDRRDQAVPG